MFRHLIALTLAFSVLGVAAAPAGPLRDRLAARQAEESRAIDLAAITPGARKSTLSYGPNNRQAIDIYTPAHADKAPIIVMVHGGAWMIGDKANIGSVENKLSYWLPRGFIFISVNYRLLPDAMAMEQAQDVADALRYIQNHAADWGGDPNRIILMGHSAGAHLVALLSSNPAMVGRPWAGTVVLDSAVMKVSDVMASRHPRFYDQAFGADPAYWTRASPMDQWSPAAVPMLLVCSQKRPDHPCDAANAFHDLAARAGQDMPVVPQNLTHEEVNRTLGLPGPYTATIDAFITASLKTQ